MTNLINPSDLYSKINDDNLIIIDGSQDGKAAGLATNYPDLMIEGARFFDIKNVFSDTSSGLPNTFPSAEHFEKECRKLGVNKDSKIVVYDNIGLFSSPRVWWMFKTMGHDDIKVLNGGLPAWINEDLPTVKKTSNASYKEGNFTAHFDASKIRYAEDILKNIESEAELVLDARGKARFDGTVEEPRPGMRSGHIPGSYNLPFKELLDNGKLKPNAELKEIFNQKLPNRKNIIFSCGSGITAAILHLAAAEVLDVPMSIYDGSWSEWGKGEYPVAKS